MTKACAECYQFGIVSTKLNGLIAAIGVVVVPLLGWICLSLYSLNAIVTPLGNVDDRLHSLEREVFSDVQLRDMDSPKEGDVSSRLGCDIQEDGLL